MSKRSHLFVASLTLLYLSAAGAQQYLYAPLAK